MKKLYFLKTMLLLCALVAGSGSVWADNDYQLVTDASTLADGDIVIFATSKDNGSCYAMGGANGNNNRKAVSTSVSSSKITTNIDNSSDTKSTVNTKNTSLTNPYEVTLVKSGDNWNLKEVLSDGDVYLNGGYYSSGNKNYLNASTSVMKETGTGKANGVWSISIDNSGIATIKNQNNYTIYVNGTLFASYSTKANSYLNVYIYKKIIADPSAPSISAANITPAYNATSGTISYTITNEDADAVISASTDDSWISNFTYTSGNVTFSLSKNTTSSDRVGTVMLTYSKNATTLASKEVTVTQGHLDVAAPTFSVAAGTYNATQSVTLSTETDGATIYYTSDGSTPTTSSASYSSAIAVDVSTTIKAIAVMDGVSSTVAEAAYELKVKTPTVNPNGGTFDESQDVTLACETESASIYYTLDGTTPTSASTAYTESFSLNDTKTVKVIATKTGWTDSEVATATFTKIDPNNVWVKTGLSALTSGDVFVIVGYSGNKYYAMSNGNGTSNAPNAVTVSINNNLISGDVEDNIKWNIGGNATDGYTFYPNGSTTTWLYCTDTNNGTRVGTNTNNTFEIEIKSNYLYNKGQGRYIGIYNSQDWRCYTSINTNISGQSFATYKKGISVTLNTACTDGSMFYGTFCSSVPFKFPADVTVSEIGIDANGKLNVVNYEAGAVVPANTGVMISSSTAGKKTFTLASGGTSVLGDDNCLRASGYEISDITATAMSTADASCKFYRLTMHNGTDIGFWWGAENGAAFTLGANKAYLAVPTGSSVRQGLWFNDEVSGIDAALVNSEERTVNSEVYDLQGRRVESSIFNSQSSILKKGLYIVNGKKVIK